MFYPHLSLFVTVFLSWSILLAFSVHVLRSHFRVAVLTLRRSPGRLAYSAPVVSCFYMNFSSSLYIVLLFQVDNI